MNKTWTFLLIFISFLFSCKKETTPVGPQIQFIIGSGLTSADKQMAIGAPVTIGIEAIAGSAAITNIHVYLENESGTEIALDSGLYSHNFQYFKSLSFGASGYEKWTFTVMDKNRLSSSVTLTLTKDPSSSFGPIVNYPSIKIGMQENPTFGSFMATSTGHLYLQDSATILQSIITFIAYYGELNLPPTEYTLSSPNETDAPKYFSQIPGWIQKNEIRYKFDSTSVSLSAFDSAYNDSIILANYTSATQGKRKFKRALPGYVVPFQITLGPETGKRGLIKIINVNGGKTGTMEIAIKMQP